MSEKGKRILKRVLMGLGVVVLLALGGMTYMIGGPKNLIGMLRYDQRQEGKLRRGDRAPDVALVALDGQRPMPLASVMGDKPLVLVFGSFT